MSMNDPENKCVGNEKVPEAVSASPMPLRVPCFLVEFAKSVSTSWDLLTSHLLPDLSPHYVGIKCLFFNLLLIGG